MFEKTKERQAVITKSLLFEMAMVAVLICGHARGQEKSSSADMPIRVSLASDVKTLRVGQSLPVEVRIENVSKKEYVIAGMNCLTGGIDPSGKEIPFEDEVQDSFESDSLHAVYLYPGCFYGMKYPIALFDKPGEYKIWVTYHGPESKKVDRMWVGTVKSNVVTVNVTE